MQLRLDHRNSYSGTDAYYRPVRPECLAPAQRPVPRWALIVVLTKAARFSRRLGPHTSLRPELHRWWGRSQEPGCVIEQSLEAFRKIGPGEARKTTLGGRVLSVSY